MSEQKETFKKKINNLIATKHEINQRNERKHEPAYTISSFVTDTTQVRLA
jgi:hypothetical protein